MREREFDYVAGEAFSKVCNWTFSAAVVFVAAIFTWAMITNAHSKDGVVFFFGPFMVSAAVSKLFQWAMERTKKAIKFDPDPTPEPIPPPKSDLVEYRGNFFKSVEIVEGKEQA